MLIILVLLNKLKPKLLVFNPLRKNVRDSCFYEHSKMYIIILR